MPHLRKRKTISYLDEDEEDEEDKSEAQKNLRKPGFNQRKRKAVSDIDEKEVLKNRRKSAPKPQPRKKSATNTSDLLLSDSGCDSEPEVTIRPPKAKRVRKAQPEPEVSPYFDWAPVIEQKDIKKGSEVKEEAMAMEEDEVSSEEEDWEDVDTAGEAKEEIEEVRWDEEAKTLEIDVEEPTGSKKKARRCGGMTESELEAEFRRAWEKHRRAVQQDMHLVHLLCLLAHGRRLSARVCASRLLHAVAFSILPPELATFEDGKKAKQRVERLLEFAAEHVGLGRPGSYSEGMEGSWCRLMALLRGEAEKEKSRKLRVLAVCILLRAAGLQNRLVHVLRPVPLKPPKEEKETTKVSCWLE